MASKRTSVQGTPAASDRLTRALRRAGVTSPEQLRGLSRAALRQLPGIGAGSAATLERLQKDAPSQVDALFPVEDEDDGPLALVDSGRAALRLRYAPDGTVRRTYAEVAAELGTSEVRAFQLRKRALTKLGRIAQTVRAGDAPSDEAAEDLLEFGPLFVLWWEGKLP